MNIIFNGELRKAEEMDLLPGFWPKGSGYFETLRAEGNHIFALHRHLCRAKESANFDLPSEIQVRESLNTLFSVEKFPISRVRISFSDNGDWMATNQPYVDPAPAKLTIFKELDSDLSPKYKKYPYERNIALHQNAQKDGFEDGIVLNKNLEVTETSFSNIFLEISGKWVTPPISAGILNGVMRAIALEAKAVVVSPITENDLQSANKGLLISSLRIAQEISEISGRKLAPSTQKASEIRELNEAFRGF